MLERWWRRRRGLSSPLLVRQITEQYNSVLEELHILRTLDNIPWVATSKVAATPWVASPSSRGAPTMEVRPPQGEEDMADDRRQASPFRQICAMSSADSMAVLSSTKASDPPEEPCTEHVED